MKQDIHPEFHVATVTCSCGNTFQTRSVKSELHVELCNQCHPFYTGKQKLVDTGGRVERFKRKYAAQQESAKEKRAKFDAEQAERQAAAAEAKKGEAETEEVPSPEAGTPTEA